MNRVPGKIEVVMLFHRAGTPGLDAGRVGELHRCTDLAESQRRRAEPGHACFFREALDFSRVLESRRQRLFDEQRLLRRGHRPGLFEGDAAVAALEQDCVDAGAQRPYVWGEFPALDTLPLPGALIDPR